MRLLVIQNEPEIIANLTRGLQAHRFVVDTALHVDKGLEFAYRLPYDLVILDPFSTDSLNTRSLERLRAANQNVPVIVLTGNCSLAQLVTCFELGADDCMRRPFAFSELRVRINALIRRCKIDWQRPRAAIGDFELDPTSRGLRIQDKWLMLTPAEYQVLDCLACSPNQTLSRTHIVERLSQTKFARHPKLVDGHVFRIRRKLDGCERQNLIETIAGEGYLLRLDTASGETAAAK